MEVTRQNLHSFTENHPNKIVFNTTDKFRLQVFMTTLSNFD